MVETMPEVLAAVPAGARMARALERAAATGATRAVPPRHVADRAAAAAAVIERGGRALAARHGASTARSVVADWLLGNAHVLREARRLLSHDVPPSFARVLPALSGRGDGRRRIDVLAAAIVAESPAPLDGVALERLIEEFQAVTTLSTGELWALPAFLRLAYLEDLAVLLARPPPPGAARGGADDARPDAEDEQRTRRAVLGLRELAAIDWRAFVERVSPLEAILRTDPGGSHPRSDFETRDRARRAAEAIARGGRIDERAVARLAVEAASRVPAAGGKARHVAWHLLGPGRPALEARAGYRAPLRERPARFALAHPTPVYLGAVALVTAGLEACAGAYAGGRVPTPGVALTLALALVPAITVAVAAVNALVTAIVPPRRLARLDLSDGIPDDARTLVAVPVLIGRPEEVRELLEGLERDFVGNEDRNVAFALLTDLPDADAPVTPGDEEILRVASVGIAQLNARHSADGRGPFLLLHRHRRWSEPARRYMGWERKRGKLHELLQALLTEDSSAFGLRVGDLDRLRGVRHVLTRDADTRLPPTSVVQLVAALTHPLNRPILDAHGRVLDGYAILQPRLEPSPESARRTAFTRALTGDRGLDPYSTIVSDVHHDLFDDGIYAGKGLLDVAAFQRSLEGRVPEHALLSHDLFEGLHGGAALASDVVLLESVPPDVPAFLARSHRWIRGDWQLLPWLGRRVPGAPGTRLRNRFGWIGRWRILDNLRRSLVAPSLLLLAVAGWAWMPGASLAPTLGVLGTLAAPLAAGLIATALRARASVPWGVALARGVDSSRRALSCAAATLVLLPLEAWSAADAIGRTLWRLSVSRRRLLEWTPASEAERRSSDASGPWSTVRATLAAPAIAAGAAALVAVTSPRALASALPLLALWFAAPGIAHALGRRRAERPETLPAGRRGELRALARRTWLYFERFVGPEDHWLPPDNFQEDPGGRLARRTSPTNVGLALLSTLGAHDLGYVGLLGLEARLRATFDALRRLERFRGHFYNWYETHRLTPLEPRYVSTVDSGNLLACLWTTAVGCEEGPRTAVCRIAQRDGIVDTIDVLREVLLGSHSLARTEGARETLRALDALRDRIEAAWGGERLARTVRDLDAADLAPLEERLARLAESGARRVDPYALGNLRIWTGRLRERVTFVHRELATLAPWLGLREAARQAAEGGRDGDGPTRLEGILASMPESPRLHEVPDVCAAAGARLAGLRAELAARPLTRPEALLAIDEAAAALKRCAKEASDLADRLLGLAKEARRVADEADFAFLYDPRRRLLHLGYDASTGRLDPNHYDLLASEARLASLVAIAKGDVPARHWLHLGRAHFRLGRTTCLRSWSGTMFEYLMPCLLLRSPARTLLGESCDAAIAAQIEEGRRRGLPWGQSESGFGELGADGAYGYRAFGAPLLALRPGTDERYVVAPYASLLALTRRPEAVLRNLDQLRDLGMVGRYGLCEALDYGSLATARPRAFVRSYMAHHQGMILLSLCNALLCDVFVRRLGADGRVRAFELLLDERVPVASGSDADVRPAQAPLPAAPVPPPAVTVPVPTDAIPPRVDLLSNGRLDSWVTAAGGGGLRWHGVALTRWRTDGWEDAGGTWVYLRDESTGTLWSLGERPVPAPAGAASARFGPHVVELQRREEGILARMEIAVAPWDDVEVRRITLLNDSGRARWLRVTTANELLLERVKEARRHPAFARLFVETELLPEVEGVHAWRRARSPEDEPVHLVQSLAGGGAACGERTFETDRARFFGRHGADRGPEAVRAGALSNRQGAVLDPVLAISTAVRVAPGAQATFLLLTCVARSRERAIGLVEAHRAPGAADAVFDQARRERERAMHDRGIAPLEAGAAHDLLSAALAPWHGLRTDPGPIDGEARPTSHLWRHGISGDLPIVLLRLAAGSDLGVALEAQRLHAFLEERGAGLDLVLLDEEPSGYASMRRERLASSAAALRGRRTGPLAGGVFLVPRDQLDPASVARLEAAAAVVLDDRRPIAAQLARLDEGVARLPAFVPSVAADASAPPATPTPVPELLRDNGYGGIVRGGREYAIRTMPGRPTPAPWGNVLSNPSFGCFVSEAGSGWTWAGSSTENRLTPWRNDPVRDDPGEALYLRDEESGAVWTPTMLPSGGAAPGVARHAPSSSTFERRSHGLDQRMTVGVAWDEPVKLVTLRLENLEDRPRRLTATYYAEWVLGPTRETTAPHLLTSYEDGVLLARNPTSASFAARVAFLATDARPQGVTCDRIEFLGRGGVRDPDGLRRLGLSGAVGGRLDPCAALQAVVTLAPKAAVEVTFVLGQGADLADARRLVSRFRRPEGVAAARSHGDAEWERLLGAVEVRTPEPDLDLLMNGRLLHQVVACRLWGRSGLYQPGGAFGFRDQLQDSMALVAAAPDLARGHLLEAARRQFPEGDVLHWWHSETGAGVRTRCSDDRLWLPFAVAHYVQWTGDAGLLREEVPFLAGAPLAPGERERYAEYGPGGPAASLAEHCLRALERDAGEGPHGLPLIGTGDWNDGMNRVGEGGRGESVWLGWFLYAALTRFAPLCASTADAARAEGLRARAEALRRNVERAAWDGRWYLRAFYDDGAPLGGAASSEARIDLVAQAWAVMSGAANRSRAARAMASAADHLVRPEGGLVLLLAPPFDRSAHDPGYVKAYPPGVRENGAQYTHAAVWGAWAFAVLGDGDTAVDWVRMLSPLQHARTPGEAERYRVEPYVLAGDVSTGDGYEGRGGWTWYTGSAAWMYRLGLERILGIRRSARGLVVDPCIPAGWPGFEVAIRHGDTRHRVRVENPLGVSRGVSTVTLDGTPVTAAAVPLEFDGRTHDIVVVLGRPETAV